MNRTDAERAALRDEIRTWLAEHVPRDWRARMQGASREDYVAFQKTWFAALRERGWAAPHWPVEDGGAGFDVRDQAAFYAELAHVDAPRLSLYFVALNHVAASLRYAGTEEQRHRFLPAILDGQVWCQGFSEPEAGSDLVSLRTRAVRRGDEYVVNGHKIWSSRADSADWCLLLARTDPDAKPRNGLTYLLMDMTSPGITVRPIRQSSGSDEFCEMFLEDVVIPAENRLGPENEGWAVAGATLSTERGATMVELAERLAVQFDDLVALARRATDDDGNPVCVDSTVRQQVAACDARVAAVRRLAAEVLERAALGAELGAESSVIKLVYADALRQVTRLGTMLEGMATLRYAAPIAGAAWDAGSWLLDYMGSWAWSIAGGTNEIQRSIVGERILGLPREPAAR
ncbi:acyl-CoA dehydrogenase family protein [[Mycobacterium] vasticus]|uniref:Acyl-CoA dehydrogenase family protein n=1 Tax=[Mycobacterium] vasticus TaxID=2875777 RepID=A0ABU5YYR4_9MYCO|nr:acyl-CoA dehydrogenase family protein [Mycolicibacter sp. MYC017]MEB3070277.1 acyl-CoA dehydrogenase family protein [Mycolicibacter sp. MYC017]